MAIEFFINHTFLISLCIFSYFRYGSVAILFLRHFSTDRNLTVYAQSRQSTRLFLQSSGLGPPPPSPVGERVPPPSWPGGDVLAGEGGVGPNSNEGTDTVILYVFFWFNQYEPLYLL